MECRSSDLPRLRQLVQKTYSTINNLPGQLIPSNLPHLDNKHLLRNYVIQQNRYIDDHRNISIFGVTEHDLLQVVRVNDKDRDILSLLKKSTAIKWISPTSLTTTEGKWNISTTENQYQSAIETITSVIIDKIPNSSSNMLSLDELSVKSSLTESTRTYLDVLTTKSPASTSMSDVPTQVTNDSSYMVPPPITVTSPTSPPGYHNYIPTQRSQPSSHVSSLTTKSAGPTRIEFDNMKEHIHRTLTTMKRDFESFKTTVRSDFQKQLNTALTAQSEKFQSAIDSLESTSSTLQSQVSQLHTFHHQLTQDIPKMIREEMQQILLEVKSDTFLKPAKRPRESSAHPISSSQESAPLTQDISLVEQLETPTAMDTSTTSHHP